MMAQSGVFRLVLKDERFDAAFTASEALRERLAKIRAEQKSRGVVHPQPTFADLEKTHIMYVRGSYRPFAAVASEYIRVKSNGDGAAIGQTGGTVSFSFPIHGHFTSDMVFHVQFRDVGRPNALLPSGSFENPTAPRYRFCAYPGIRLFPRVSLRSDETLIDDYVRDEMCFADKFQIPADRRTAWDRGLGQAEVRTAEFFNPNGYTEVYSYKEGLQTPKFFHPTQDLWVPLQFWMCKDASGALLNDLVPNTQRTVVAELAPIDEIIQALDPATGAVIPLPFDRLAVQIDLYVNNLFMLPEIHEIFASRLDLSFIRVHRRQRKILNMASASILMDQLKYPAEYLYVGFRDVANRADFDRWHLFGRARVRTNATALLAPAMVWNTALGVGQLVYRTAKEVGTLDQIVQAFKFTAHGIDLFPNISESFFNSYLPQRYFGGTAVIAPQDTSAYMATFCLYPGQFNPSGYYNLSAGRELYLTYQGKDIDAARPAELVVSMSALNFILRRGDKLHLKFAL